MKNSLTHTVCIQTSRYTEESRLAKMLIRKASHSAIQVFKLISSVAICIFRISAISTSTSRAIYSPRTLSKFNSGPKVYVRSIYRAIDLAPMLCAFPLSRLVCRHALTSRCHISDPFHVLVSHGLFLFPLFSLSQCRAVCSDSRPEHERHWRRHLVHARDAHGAGGALHVQQSTRRTRARTLSAARYA